jgi:hypothetical protein
VNLLLSLILIFFIATNVFAVDLSCDDLFKLDAGKIVEALSKDEYHNRLGCHPSEGAAGCDWVTELKEDQKLQPNHRLIVTNADHKKGTAAWDHLAVFTCSKGIAKVVFQKEYLYGVSIKENSQRRLSIEFGKWKEKDPMCCPSNTQAESYLWNTEHDSLKKVESSISQNKANK